MTVHEEMPVTRTWPPADAEAVDTADLYARLAARGFDYGPAFKGVRAAWRSGDDIYAEVEVDRGRGREGSSFLLHPALFDAALHAALDPILDGQDSNFLPFIIRRVRVHRPGTEAIRVHLTLNGDNAVSLSATDSAGAAVASVGTVALRPVSTEQLGAAGQSGRLLRLEWKRMPLPSAADADGQCWAFLGTDHLGLTEALKAAGRQVGMYQSLHSLDSGLRGGDAVPDVIIVSCTDDADGAAAVRTATQRALVLVQEWLADERLAGSRLMFVTRGAVATGAEEDCPDLAGAAVWGLIRSAQSEHPGRFALVDLDDAENSEHALVAAVAAAEPQLAVRHGGLVRPRLTRCPPAPRAAARRWDPDGTILITGGTGALGGLVARHLVRRHNVRHLLLLSRKGPQAPGAAELTAELAELGAEARVVAGDAAVPADLERVLSEIPHAHPLTAVLHSAGVVADGTIAALTPRRLEQVLRPKVDAVLNLHELTQDMPSCELVLFSSVSGLFGGAGQGNYAAANAFLDALAHRRQALGLRAVSLAWGLWDMGDGMGGELGAADLSRIARSGLSAMSAEEGLALFDASRTHPEPLLVPVKLNEAVLGTGASSLPEMLLDLVPKSAGDGRAAGRGDEAKVLREVLAQLPDAERERAIVEFVCAQVAAVLGHAGPDAIDAERELAEAGFDSLTNLELSRRLATATGLRLPATLSFDYPTPAELARHLRKLLVQTPNPAD